MKFRHLVLLAVPALLSLSCTHKLKDGEYTLTVLTTNDVHGTWFDSTYVQGGKVRKSLFAVNHYVDSVRTAEGPDRVVLVDVGDCLQGDNAAYYFNYVDTLSPHLFPRLLNYMKYDAVVWGNHDVETGHKVYDRVSRELNQYDIPFLAGNAIREDNGKSYFPAYKIMNKGGLRVALLGYENANIKAWLAEELWSGMHFDSIISRVQQDVDAVRAKEHPDVVIVGIHSGTGAGDGSSPESEGLDIFNQVKNVDFLLCAHDHRPYVETRDSTALINSGSHCRYLGFGQLHLTVEKGKIAQKTFETKLIPVDAKKADPQMRAAFQKDYEAVKAFTLQEVGILNTELRTRDAFSGMCDYVNLLHTLSLGCEPAQISFASPLTYNGHVQSGPIIFNDLFTIYPFENQLFVAQLTGEEVRLHLETSYDDWIQTLTKPGDHILKIHQRSDARTQQEGWSFIGRSYNFDSAAGIWYTVDVTQPRGSRIKIEKMADGTPFDPQRIYNVAMTSYRANGGGGLLQEAGVDTDAIDERIVARYPEIRNILYDYLMKNGSIDPEVIGDPAVIGGWKFVPEKLAQPALEADMALLFKR